MDWDKLFGNMASNIDMIDRLEGIISGFLKANWSGALEQYGFGGLLRESASYLSGHSSPMIKVEHYNTNTSWSGIRIEWLLARHGIDLFDRGIEGDNLYFRVKRRQLNWAEYVLLRAGVPVTVVRDQRNVEWVSKFPVGDEPASHSTHRNHKRRNRKRRT